MWFRTDLDRTKNANKICQIIVRLPHPPVTRPPGTFITVTNILFVNITLVHSDVYHGRWYCKTQHGPQNWGRQTNLGARGTAMYVSHTDFVIEE